MRRCVYHHVGRLIVLLGVVVAWSPRPAVAQIPVERPLVLPFAVSIEGEVPGGEGASFWLGEAAALLLAEALDARGAFPFSRADRVEAFERLQLPKSAALTRATMIRVAELVGATDLVIGDVRLGAELTVTARIIRLENAKEQAKATATGSSADIYDVLSRTADALIGRKAAAPPTQMPLGAFEQYVKGLVATTPAVQERFLETARQQSGGDSRVLLALWDLYTADGRHDRALASAVAVSRDSPDDRAARYAAAISLIELRRFDEAYARLQDLHGERPSPIFSNALGVIQMRRGSTPQTGLPTYFFTRAVDEAPDHPEFLFNLGYAYARSREAEPAIYWLREAVGFDPADGDAHLVMSQMLMAAGRRVEAQRELDLARLLGASVEPTVMTPTERVSAGLERLPTRFEEQPTTRVASAIANPAQREQQELATFHLGRGRRLLEQGDDRAALDELRRAVYLRPYDADAHVLLGQLYRRAGRLAEAADALRIAVWAKDSVQARLQLAETLSDLGDTAGALAHAKSALQLDPSSVAARDLVARLGGGRV